MSKIPDKDKDWIRRLLLEGNSCAFIAEEWQVDTSYLYRKLRLWGLNSKGQAVEKNMLTVRQQKIFNYMEKNSFNVTRKEVSKAMRAALETVDAIVKIKGVKLITENQIERQKMLNKVRLARTLRKSGDKRSVAIFKAGLTFYEYKHWLAEFNREMKKAPQ